MHSVALSGGASSHVARGDAPARRRPVTAAMFSPGVEATIEVVVPHITMRLPRQDWQSAPGARGVADRDNPRPPATQLLDACSRSRVGSYSAASGVLSDSIRFRQLDPAVSGRIPLNRGEIPDCGSPSALPV